MAWAELAQRRTQTAKHWLDDTSGQRHFEQIIKTPLHYQSTLDSGVFDAAVDLSPQRINAGGFDGWRITQNGWHYAIGSQSGLPGDGWVGFGGRQGQNWLKFKLMRAGYLHWPTRAWQDVGGVPAYNRANLNRQTQTIIVGPPGAEATLNAASLATWQNIWPGVDIRWLVDGLHLKEEIVLSEATRNNLPAPGTPASETYFGFVFRLDLSDVPRIVKNGLLQNKSDDFDDDDGLLEIKDDADRLLAFMPIDYAYSELDENGERQQVRLRKRLWLDGDGNHYLIVGAPVLELNALPAGAIIFDPTFSDQPDETAAKDTYIASFAATTNFGTSAQLQTRAGVQHSLLDWDLSSIPSGATCDAATMSLWSAENKAGAPSFGIFVLLSAWTEAGATWNTYDGTNNWPGSAGASTSGTDYEADATPPQITYPISSIDTEAQADLTSGENLTAAKIASKFGGTLSLTLGQTGSTNARFWHSSSVATAGFRPKISVDYTEAAGGRVTKNTDSHPLGIHAGIGRRVSV